jgi:hypothetical protein
MRLTGDKTSDDNAREVVSSPPSCGFSLPSLGTYDVLVDQAIQQSCPNASIGVPSRSYSLLSPYDGGVVCDS